MKPSNHMGDYAHTIRVNGRRSVVGVGHTAQEALRNALDAAKEVWRADAHIYEMLRPLPAHKALQRNT